MSNTLTYDEAIALLPEGDEIHTFRNGGFSIIGADWGREQLIEAIKAAPVIGITGSMAQAMKHGMVIDEGGKHLFIETTSRTDGEDE